MSADTALYRIRLGVPGRADHAPQWRSLRQLDASVPDRDGAGEFPPGASARPSANRREFMQLVGAGLVLGSGCSSEVPRKVLPYNIRPADVVPGVPTSYATSMVIDGYATGLLVQSREGRPIKVEANPEHPATAGGTSLYHQASIRQLYDDARARSPRRADGPLSWEELLARLQAPRVDGGRGLRVLLEPTGSPQLLDLLARARARHHDMRVAFFAPLAGDAEREGARLAFGRPLLPQLDLGAADAILALDADLLNAFPLSLRYARQWAGRRRLRSPHDEMSRLYVAESLLSVTGSMADNRLRCQVSRIPAVALAVAARLPGLKPSVSPAHLGAGPDAAWAEGVARDLAGRPAGSTAIVAGERQPAEVHALCHAMNVALGNLGATVSLREPAPERMDRGQTQSLAELVAEMRAGEVDTLVIVDANPVYTAPADLRFAEALRHVPHALCFGYYEDETALACETFAPLTHYLESWGDARAYDGTVSLIQPLVRPLVDARSVPEILASLAGDPHPDGHRLLHDFWRHARGLSEVEFEDALRRGFIAGTALPSSTPTPSPTGIARAVRQLEQRPGAVTDRSALEIELYPSPTVHDGRFANNPWLQELPSPIGKLTWDNAVFVSPATARALGVTDEQVVELAVRDAKVRGPVLVVPGLADQVAALWLGYGRRGHERIAAGVGFDAYALRTQEHLHVVPGVRATPTPERRPLALTQLHWSTYGRPIALRKDLADYRADPTFTAEHKAPLYSLMRPYAYKGDQWAMTIDLGICTGCSTCMVACQAENNVSVVGKEQVLNSREMHWLRIDTYFGGPPESPSVVHQPMMCQHCEKAPCEYVCPVGATVHSDDGLNEMVYNRCVGTRFCSNNCPYKVRRFNWFDWGDAARGNRGLVDLQYSPEVTVRERGVMEKCTYCVQRIRAAQIHARVEEREIAPGEVVTACQAACPTGAIQFGSLAHRDSEMVRWRQQDRSYAVLHHVGTQPRTFYLARIDNPNEALR
jgi:Fe-S-cluster-containing dehydrogenase component